MSKSIFEATDIENLISNLRGEVGGIIQSWILMRDFYILSSELQTDNFTEDIKNQELNKINLIKKKFQDDISGCIEFSHIRFLIYSNYPISL